MYFGGVLAPADTVLIITNRFDEHASHVVRALNKRHVPVFRLNTEDFPKKIRLVWKNDRWEIKYFSRQLVPEGVLSLWYRRPVDPIFHDVITDPGIQTFIRDECWYVLAGLYRCLQDIVWVSHPDALAASKYKVRQLQAARRIGFRVPDTLITNDRDAFMSFWEEHGGRAIVKIAGRGPNSIPKTKAIYTNLVAERDLRITDSIRFCPHLFQEYVEKAYEVRVTLIGETLFAVKIDSQSLEETRIDWRREGIEDVPHTPITLPAVIEEKCRQLIAGFGLNFGAVDLIVTPEDEWVFLEINPNGQWLWLEELTGLPMTETMCNLLSQRG